MYAYDPQLSIQLAKNHPELFEMRACYNNVYNMVMQHLEELTPREKLRILFCYRKGNGDEYYRHAFCLFDGKLVEPLLYLDMSDPGDVCVGVPGSALSGARDTTAYCPAGRGTRRHQGTWTDPQFI